METAKNRWRSHPRSRSLLKVEGQGSDRIGPTLRQQVLVAVVQDEGRAEKQQGREKPVRNLLHTLGTRHQSEW